MFLTWYNKYLKQILGSLGEGKRADLGKVTVMPATFSKMESLCCMMTKRRVLKSGRLSQVSSLSHRIVLRIR